MTTILSLMYLAFVATIVGYGSGGRYWDAMKPGGLHRYRYGARSRTGKCGTIVG